MRNRVFMDSGLVPKTLVGECRIDLDHEQKCLEEFAQMMKSTITLDRNDEPVPLCVCDHREGTKGDICQNCDGAIPNSHEQISVNDILSRINRPEKK